MALLRFIDVSGEEQDIADVDHLYQLITVGQIGYDSLVRDEKAGGGCQLATMNFSCVCSPISIRLTQPSAMAWLAVRPSVIS